VHNSLKVNEYLVKANLRWWVLCQVLPSVWVPCGVGVLPCRVPVSRSIRSSSCLSLADDDCIPPRGTSPAHALAVMLLGLYTTFLLPILCGTTAGAGGDHRLRNIDCKIQRKGVQQRRCCMPRIILTSAQSPNKQTNLL